jgi:hypothetical protein
MSAMNRLNSLVALPLFALLLSGCIFDDYKEDSGYYSTKIGSRSLSKGIFTDTELEYSFAYPKTWEGGLLKVGEAVAYWTADTGIAYAAVYECDLDSNNLCDFFLEADSVYGVPGKQARQGKEVIVHLQTDTTATRIRIRMHQRIHFQHGNKTVMFWLIGTPADFAAGTDLKRLDSSLTFF